MTLVACGDRHTVAVSSAGQVRAWGDNYFGQLNVPADLGVALSAACSYSSTTAVVGGGQLRSWGRNDAGESTPPSGVSGVVEVSGGADHLLARRVDGSLVAWGSNADGKATVPTDLGAVVSARAGVNHSVALRADGTVVCWGNNDAQQCVVPPTLGKATLIAAGERVSMAYSPTFRWPARSLPQDFYPWPLGAFKAGSLFGFRSIEITGEVTDPLTINGTGTFFLRALEDASIQGDVIGAGGGQMIFDGRLVATGIVATYSDGKIISNLESGSEFGVVGSHSNGSTYPLVIEGRSPSLIRNQVNIAVNMTGGKPDISCAHRLVLRDGVYNSSGSTAAVSMTLVACSAPEFASVTPAIEFAAGSSIDLSSNSVVSEIFCIAPTTTLLNGNATLRTGTVFKTDADLAIGGSARVPAGNSTSCFVDRVHPADPAFEVRGGGELVIESGASLQLAAPKRVAVAGELTVDQQGLFSLVGGIDRLEVRADGAARCFGGTIRADEVTVLGGLAGVDDQRGEVVGVSGLLDTDIVRVQGGAISFADSTLVGDLVTEFQYGGDGDAQIAASGQFFGSVDNDAGRITTIGDLVIVGDVDNGVGGTLVAQVGTMYITGDLVNAGKLYGNIVTAPGYGGDGGTQAGDGLRIQGSLAVGSAATLRFEEDLWRLAVCGDVSLACPSFAARFDGAVLALDGCEGSSQSLEVTSGDLGCTADAFSGEEPRVTLIGELAVESGALVELVDAFDNDSARGPEALYARSLRVASGATLVTNGRKVYTRNAQIAGSVDDPANICVLPEPPDADINGDGIVNGQDLTFVLGFWNSANALADLNRDGTVNALDLAIVLAGWTGG